MHDTLYDLVSSYGYLIVFLLVGIESLGIPLPGETALITASAFAALGRLNIFVVVASAAAGAIIGSAYARPYYGGYGYYQPAPVYDDYAPAYYGYSAPGPYYGCWRWRNGYRYRVC